MDIQIQISSSDPAELARVFAALAGAAPVEVRTNPPASSEPAKVSKPAKASKPAEAKADPVPAEPKPDPKSAPAPAETKPAPAEASINYDTDVRPVLLKAIKDPAIGFEAVQALLGRYGAAKGQDLKPDQLGRFLDELNGLGEAEPDSGDAGLL